MIAPETTEALRSAFGEVLTLVEPETGDSWIEVALEDLYDVAQRLRTDERFDYDYLNCLSGVDYFHTDPKKAAKAKEQPHLQLVYHLSSTRHKNRLVLKVRIPRWKDDLPGELPEVPSVLALWNTADWHEREVYDLVGVRFVGHTNLRRILCPDDWEGHPLRKDYEMPLEYHGIRGR